MTAKVSPALAKRLTAKELRRLSAHERNSILAAAAAQAASEYRTDRDLTDFEAFGKDDLYGESSDTKTR